MKSIADLLREHRFFLGVEPSTIDLVAGCGRNVEIPSHTLVIREGEHADVFWAIRHGRISVGLNHPTRGLVPLETLGEGDVLGWSWLFPPYRWHFDAETLEPVRAVVFDAACLRAKCAADPRLGYELTQSFARVMDERLHATRLRLLDVYGSPVPG